MSKFGLTTQLLAGSLDDPDDVDRKKEINENCRKLTKDEERRVEKEAH